MVLDDKKCPGTKGPKTKRCLLSTTELLDTGNYLDEGFDPNSLTIPILRGILLHHGITVPDRTTKTKLVELFRHQITVNLAGLKAVWLQRKNSAPCGDGITQVNFCQAVKRKRFLVSHSKPSHVVP